MTREIVTACAQLGPIGRAEPRAAVVDRLVTLMERAARGGAQLVVFPELALTTFFPRWDLGEADLDPFYETEMPNPAVEPLFAAARRLGVGFHLGYAELVSEGGVHRRFNTAILVDGEGRIVHKYRKVHLPGHREPEPWRPFQHLEKRYFERGDLGFPVSDTMGGRLGVLICNDRRWPEAFRMLGLAGVEMVCVGYNTPQHYPLAPQQDHLQDFHNLLSLQAGAYQNGTWVVGVAKCGVEEGCLLIGGSAILAPTGEIAARCTTLADEVCLAACDLDRCAEIKANIFDFKQHREPDTYGLLTAPKR
ncbi:MAG: N-carbamoyl-D-amino-acid hydrolase [Deinococcus-Thermus bacterium]|jgi:predicted amidohydrolase|nr:N-carbamoyl-D-amino-acid hydrolase [Deinococcota bacterium]